MPVSSLNDDDSAVALPQCSAGTRVSRGRVSRRRRRKVFEIQQALLVNSTSVVSSNTVTTTTPLTVSPKTAAAQQHASKDSLVPTDRSYSWPTVLALRQQTPNDWTVADEAMLQSQLGFLPGNAFRVLTRVRDVDVLQNIVKNEEFMQPIVIQLYPLALRKESAGKKGRKRKRHDCDDKNKSHLVTTEQETASTNDLETVHHSLMEPFPTLYWLTYPLLRSIISKLEVSGFGVALEQRLAADLNAKARMEQSHLAYAVCRHALLTKSDVQMIHERNWNSAFDPHTRGVAGIRNFLAVKCLHAHAAHYLSSGPGSRDNVIGEWVVKQVHDDLLQNKQPIGLLKKVV